MRASATNRPLQQDQLGPELVPHRDRVAHDRCEIALLVALAYQLAQHVMVGRLDRGELLDQAERGPVLTDGGDLVLGLGGTVTGPPAPGGDLSQRPVLPRAGRRAAHRASWSVK
jgi:hypothetical protein